MGDVGGLMNAIKDAGLDKQPELYQKLSQGVFTLRDMYEQFQVCSHPPLAVLSTNTYMPPSPSAFPLLPSRPRRLKIGMLVMLISMLIPKRFSKVFEM